MVPCATLSNLSNGDSWQTLLLQDFEPGGGAELRRARAAVTIQQVRHGSCIIAHIYVLACGAQQSCCRSWLHAHEFPTAFAESGRPPSPVLQCWRRHKARQARQAAMAVLNGPAFT